MRKRLHLVFTLLIVFALTGCNGAQLMRKSPSTETVEAGEDVMDNALIVMVCSAFFTDPLVEALLWMFGISNFSSHPGIGNVLFPVLVVITAFTVFAWTVAGKIRTGKLVALMND